MVESWTGPVTAMVALLAFILSIYNIWYSQYKNTPLKFVINKWTLLGLEVITPSGKFISAAFLIEVSIINQSNETKVVKDIVFKTTDVNGKTFLYNPIAIFDFKYYSANFGNVNMLQAQKGIVPLPLGIPPKSTYKFEDYLLMLPYNKKTSFSLQNQPINIQVLVCEDRMNYIEVESQIISDDSLKKLSVGHFSAIESTSVLESRDKYDSSIK